MPANTGSPYLLPYPLDTDVADVPQDIKNLAEKTRDGLNGKLAQTQTDALYQRKVTVQATAPLPTQSGSEGDIIFVVP